jgi:hypothetical protein
MAWALHVYIVNPDDELILVEHIFYGETKDEASQVKEEHLGTCSYFKAAEDEDRTDEKWEQIAEEDWPSV